MEPNPYQPPKTFERKAPEGAGAFNLLVHAIGYALFLVIAPLVACLVWFWLAHSEDFSEWGKSKQAPANSAPTRRE